MYFVLLFLIFQFKQTKNIMITVSEYYKQTTFILPTIIITQLILVCSFAFWIILVLFSTSSVNIPNLKSISFAATKLTLIDQLILIVYILAFFWFNSFITACFQFIISSSTCLWYFSRDSEQPNTTKTLG